MGLLCRPTQAALGGWVPPLLAYCRFGRARGPVFHPERFHFLPVRHCRHRGPGGGRTATCFLASVRRLDQPPNSPLKSLPSSYISPDPSLDGVVLEDGDGDGVGPS